MPELMPYSGVDLNLNVQSLQFLPSEPSTSISKVLKTILN